MSGPFKRNAEIEMSALGEEVILFDPKATKFLLLNRTSSFLWRQLDTPKTAEELAAEVCRHFDGAELRGVLRDVEGALEQMASLEMVQASKF
jgi:hypothetical protein